MTAKKRLGKREARNWLLEKLAVRAEQLIVTDQADLDEFTSAELRLLEGEKATVAAKIRKLITSPRSRDESLIDALEPGLPAESDW